MRSAIHNPTPSTAGNYGRRLLRKLTEGIEDCTIVVVGDSTCAAYTTWVGKVVEGLGARFPAYTIKYRDWTDGNTEYNEASTKQTGTGSKTLTVYNCAVASKNAYYQMAPNFDAMIASREPDLIYFGHGHNHGGAGTAQGFWQEGLICATQSIYVACPTAEIVLIAQNPRTDASATVHAERQAITERVAQFCGFGFVNIHRAFNEATSNVALLLAEDGIHPNATGYALQAEVMLSQMDVRGSLRSQLRPSLSEVLAVNPLVNGDFASFAAPPTLPNWNATNATLSKDETNFESPNGYAVKVASATAASTYILQKIEGNAVRRLKGQWMTLLVRERVPVGQAAAAGQINFIETGGSHAGQNGTGILAVGQGDYRWAMCQRRIAKDATSISLQIIASSGAVSGEISVNHAILIPGIMPKDIR